MALPELQHSVWLYDLIVGTLYQRGDYTRFTFTPEYVADPERPVLGLAFEEDLAARHSAALRLPCWFSNLLPEGRLREWIAADRGVSSQREMELLAQVGSDLPGAVRVQEAVNGGHHVDWDLPINPTAKLADTGDVPPWRFSLAGVALKFSMLAKGDRLTIPATGVGGDWIVKLPDQYYAEVPRNEFTMMSLAGAVGIDTPPVRLLHRDEIDGLPPTVWQSGEPWAYAIRRFDRTDDRRPVHIEDLAQVRNLYSHDKYQGNYETVAALTYRGHDVDSLREFVRRLVFTVLISNGDAHLKNWSLIYRERRMPTLAPAYDLVSTRPYMGSEEALALKFAGSRRFDAVRLNSFARLERRLQVDASLADVAALTVKQTVEQWPRFAQMLTPNSQLMTDIESSINERARSLRKIP